MTLYYVCRENVNRDRQTDTPVWNPGISPELRVARRTYDLWRWNSTDTNNQLTQKEALLEQMYLKKWKCVIFMCYSSEKLITLNILHEVVPTWYSFHSWIDWRNADKVSCSRKQHTAAGVRTVYLCIQNRHSSQPTNMTIFNISQEGCPCLPPTTFMGHVVDTRLSPPPQSLRNVVEN